MKLDMLVFAAHPDDAELGAAGTILKHIAAGKKIGIVDLTGGELGTFGDADTRKSESASADKIMGVSVRENLNLPDGFFEINKESIQKCIEPIRKFQPEIVLCCAVEDRHPDHGRASKLVSDACFYSGLRKIKSELPAWRPKAVYHYIQDRYIRPDFVIDISEFWEKKMEAVLAYSSQFNRVDSDIQTPISSPEFLESVKARAIEFGRMINVKYAEGFTAERPLGVDSFFSLK